MAMRNRRGYRLGMSVAIGALVSACTNVAMEAVNVPSYVSGEARAVRGLAYGGEPHQKLDLYLPGEAAGGQRPLVVFVYGGGWTSGSRGEYYFVADALTDAGYAVAIPDYIKYPQGVFPAFVDDVAQAVAWLADNVAQYAPVSEFVLMGHSAGAHTAALLITDPRYFADLAFDPARIGAFVGLAGPYGFRPQEQKYRAIFANLENFDLMRPLHFANGSEPPMLLLHGEDDTTVLPVNTRKFAARIEAGGGSAQTRFYTGAGHIEPLLALSRLPFNNTAMRADILAFLRRVAPVGQADGADGATQ